MKGKMVSVYEERRCLKFYADEVEEIKNAGLLKGGKSDHVSSGGQT
mgnify:CR=1 FL=1